MFRNDNDCSEGMSEILSEKVDKIKNLYNLKSIEEVAKKVFNEFIFFTDKENKLVDEICLKINTDRTGLIVPVIMRYINKTLKGYGVFKEKSQKSAKAESELISVLQEIINNSELLPLKERKFLTPSMIHKFILISNGKYKQKHINVIRRVLESPKASFVKEYHNKNNLTLQSNYR